MSWRPITPQNIMGRFTQAEQAMLSASAGSTNKLQERLNDAIAAFYSAMNSAGYSVSTPPNMVDKFRNAVMAYAVGEWLRDFPLDSQVAKTFLTKERSDAHKNAEELLLKISEMDAGAIEPPSGYPTTGNWNSQNRIVGRMEPTPPEQSQFTNIGSNQPWFANPNATSPPAQVTAPDAPKNLLAMPSPVNKGQMLLSWVLPMNAITISIYRGTASGGEGATPIATTTSNQYIDTGLVSGTTYYYYITGTNEVGTGAKSVETYAIAP